MHFCFRPLDCLIMTLSRFRPRRENVNHRRYIQDLEKLLHDQPQRCIEQDLQLLEVGIPVCNQVPLLLKPEMT